MDEDEGICPQSFGFSLCRTEDTGQAPLTEAIFVQGNFPAVVGRWGFGGGGCRTASPKLEGGLRERSPVAITAQTRL